MTAAERLRLAVEAMPFSPVPGTTHRITASIGVCCSSAAAISPEQLLSNADQALYRAKANGRNRTTLHQSA